MPTVYTSYSANPKNDYNEDDDETEEIDVNTRQTKEPKQGKIILQDHDVDSDEGKIGDDKNAVTINTSNTDGDSLISSLATLKVQEGQNTVDENENALLSHEDPEEDLSDFEDEFNGDACKSSRSRYSHQEFALNEAEVQGIKEKVKRSHQKKKNGGRGSSNKGRVKAFAKLKKSLL